MTFSRSSVHRFRAKGRGVDKAHGIEANIGDFLFCGLQVESVDAGKVVVVFIGFIPVVSTGFDRRRICDANDGRFLLCRALGCYAGPMSAKKHTNIRSLDVISSLYLPSLQPAA